VLQACDKEGGYEDYMVNEREKIYLSTLQNNPIVSKVSFWFKNQAKIVSIKPGILWEDKKIKDDDFLLDSNNFQMLQRLNMTPGWSGKRLIFVDKNQYLIPKSSSTDDNSVQCVLWTIGTPTRVAGNKRDQTTQRKSTFELEHMYPFGVNTSVIYVLIWKTRNIWLEKFKNLRNKIEFHVHDDNIEYLQADLIKAGYNLSFGKNDEILDLVCNMCVWIEFVQFKYNKDWWQHDNNNAILDLNKKILQTKFNRRMSKIVYAVFTNETIWRVLMRCRSGNSAFSMEGDPELRCLRKTLKNV